MLPTHRIAVADSNQTTRAEISACLTRAGHRIVVEAGSTTELTERCRNLALDLVVADVQHSRSEQHSADWDIQVKLDLPVVALWQEFDDRAARSTDCSHVFAHLMKPIREAELLAAIPLAIRRFLELRALREEAANMQRVLEERKLIERAKGIIMRCQSTDEASAFRQLQTLARNHRLKMADLARSIILTHEALNVPEPIVPRSPFSTASNPLPRRRSG